MCVTLLAGCGDKEPTIVHEWDYFNTDIVIDVRDSDGWHWFDSSRPDGNLRENSVNIVYEGRTYPLFYMDPSTRAEAPELPLWEEDGRKPFRLQGHHETDTYPLLVMFGEFSIDTKEYRGESFTIDWGDGTQSVVKFDLYATPKADETEPPTIHNAVWVESGVGAGARNNNGLTLSLIKD